MHQADVKLTATVQEHRVTRESWGVARVLVVEVLEGRPPAGVSAGCELAAVGDRMGLAAPGERLELTGNWDRGKYGLQLRVLEQHSLGLHGAKDAARWLERLDGVGPALARALRKRFGEELPKVLAGEIEADLTEVSGISDAKAKLIRDSFAELAIAGDLESLRYLDSIRASRWEATQVLTWCAKRRKKPQEVLEGAPFDLMQIKGLGFKRVDRLARNAGCHPEAPARVEAATLHTLDEIVQQGSTMAPFAGGRGGGLTGQAAELLGIDKDLVRAAIRRLAAAGSVVLAQGERERTWVHPAALLRAERDIYRAAKGGRKKTNKPLAGPTAGSPGALRDQAAVPCPPQGGGQSRANGSECQGGESPRGEGAPTPVTTPAAQAALTQAEWADAHRVFHADAETLAATAARLQRMPDDGLTLEDW